MTATGIPAAMMTIFPLGDPAASAADPGRPWAAVRARPAPTRPAAAALAVAGGAASAAVPLAALAAALAVVAEAAVAAAAAEAASAAVGAAALAAGDRIPVQERTRVELPPGPLCFRPAACGADPQKAGRLPVRAHPALRRGVCVFVHSAGRERGLAQRIPGKIAY